MSNTTTTKETRGRPARAERTERTKRIPMSGSRKRMHVDKEDQDPNFHYAWINDQNDLLRRAHKAGYEHVTVKEMPHWGTRDVDSADPTSSFIHANVGHGTTAYLMKQPMEYHEEDIRLKRELNEARTADLKKDLNSGKEGTYGNVDIA